jgi:Bacterial SH3 domain
MTQYDAGPGDWSDREWEAPDWESQPHAKRRRVVLPPWALLAILAAMVILLCVGLVLIVRAIRGGGEKATPTPAPTATLELMPTEALPLTAPTAVLTQALPTMELPTEVATEAPPTSEVAPGAAVVVTGTGGAGLNLRAQPNRGSKLVVNVPDGTVLTVVDGPQEGSGFRWWKVQTKDGKVGWAVQAYLKLSTNP